MTVKVEWITPQSIDDDLDAGYAWKYVNLDGKVESVGWKTEKDRNESVVIINTPDAEFEEDRRSSYVYVEDIPNLIKALQCAYNTAIAVVTS
jgi:hypothetical protein